MQERLTRPITESEIKLFNPTRPSGSKYSEGDYVEKRDVTDLECYRKLGQLEDIEEEFGIDLITVYKALKNGIYFKSGGEVYFTNELYLDLKEKVLFELDEYGDSEIYEFNEYGEDWALTKEELECQK